VYRGPLGFLPSATRLRSILGNMIGSIELDGGQMSALGQKRTFRSAIALCALPPKADIRCCLSDG